MGIDDEGKRGQMNDTAIPDNLSFEHETLLGFCMGHNETYLRQADEIQVEMQLTIPEVTWGTCDLVLRFGKRLILIDYKFGKWKVDDPAENYQARAYVLGAFHAFPDCVTCEFIFLTPRLKLVQKHTFTREEALSWTDEFKNIVKNADDPNAPFKPDSENCLFCGNKVQCPELQKRAMQIANDNDGLMLPESAKTTDLTSPAQIKRALDVASIVERWAKNVRSAALERVLSGEEIPGYELKETRGNRKIKDVTSTWGALKNEMGQEDFLEACSISIGALEKALKAQAPRGKKAEFTASALEVLDGLGLVERGSDKIYLSKSRK